MGHDQRLQSRDETGAVDWRPGRCLMSCLLLTTIIPMNDRTCRIKEPEHAAIQFTSHMHGTRAAAISLSRLSNDEASWAQDVRSFRSQSVTMADPDLWIRAAGGFGLHKSPRADHTQQVDTGPRHRTQRRV